MTSIASRGLTLSYQRQVIIDALDMQLPQGKISVLIGSNGCGKSTLLKSFARLLKPQQGSVILNGVDIQQKSTAAVARELAILPQTPSAPEGITVRQLVALSISVSGLDAAVVGGRRSHGQPRIGANQSAGPGGSTGGRVVRRAAPTRVDRHDSGSGHWHRAARRTDHVPRSGASDRSAGLAA